MGDVSWSREGAGWELWQPETEWHGSKKPSYSRQDPPPPHYSGQNHNLWSKIFEVSLGSFCYGLVSCNLCSYLFVRACHIWCATAGNPRVKDKALSWPSSCPSAHCPCAQCPCAQPRWRVLCLMFCQTSADKKTRAFTKEKRRKRTTRSDSRALA